MFYCVLTCKIKQFYKIKEYILYPMFLFLLNFLGTESVILDQKIYCHKNGLRVISSPYSISK